MHGLMQAIAVCTKLQEGKGCCWMKDVYRCASLVLVLASGGKCIPAALHHLPPSTIFPITGEKSASRRKRLSLDLSCCRSVLQLLLAGVRNTSMRVGSLLVKHNAFL